MDERNFNDIGHADAIHLTEQLDLLIRIHFALQRINDLVHIGVLVPGNVVARPVIGLAGNA